MLFQTAIVLSVVLYFLVFVLMYVAGWTNWAIVLPGSTLLSGAIGWYYFTLTKPSFIEGLYLGLAFLIVGAIIDVLIFAVARKQAEMLLDFYLQPIFILGLALYALAPALVGCPSCRLPVSVVAQGSRSAPS